jgi:hypothetical protein
MSGWQGTCTLIYYHYIFKVTIIVRFTAFMGLRFVRGNYYDIFHDIDITFNLLKLTYSTKLSTILKSTGKVNT